MTPDRNGICEKEIIQINKHIHLKSATRGLKHKTQWLLNFRWRMILLELRLVVYLVSFLAPVLALPVAAAAYTMG